MDTYHILYHTPTVYARLCENVYNIFAGFLLACGAVLLTELRLGLFLMLYYKETAFGFGCLFWLHQG